MTRKTLYANPDLYFLQSRYAKNGFQGDSRWVIVNPVTKDMKGAIGKDGFPPVFDLLQAASQPDGLANKDAFDSLVAAGLLQETRQQPNFHSFLEFYHAYVRDYPFNDYARPRRWHKDREQMAEYGKKAFPPPQYSTNKQDDRIALPIPAFRDFNFDPDTPLSPLAAIGTAAAAVLQSTGSINGGDFGPWLRKASPSGGARHPTELRIVIRNLKTVPDGDWLYDARYHTLVDRRDVPVENEDATSVMLRFVTKVERPMWRYREARSLRPVIIDAGHVIESVGATLGTLGYQLVCEPNQATADTLDFEMPLVAQYRLQGQGLCKKPAKTPEQKPVQSASAGSFQTNPFLWLRLKDGALVASVSYPAFEERKIDSDDFRVLNHCIPSKRGDRETDADALVSKFFEGDAKRLEHLIDANFLVSRDDSKSLDAALQSWVRHGWYQSAMAYIEFANEFQDSQPKDPGARSEDWGDLASLRKLTSTKRRTTRVFSSEQLEQPALARLSDFVSSQPELADGTISARICVFDQDAGRIYDPANAGQHDQMSQPIGAAISRDEIVANSIGQFPINRASAVVWMYTKAVPSLPSSYMARLIEMGQVGQRLCLYAARENIGVFMTPAVRDSETQAMLGLSKGTDSIFYLFAFGISAEPATLPWQRGGVSPYEKLLLGGQSFVADPESPGSGFFCDPDGAVHYKAFEPLT